MTLGEHEHIVGAWAEAPSGPGWSNRLVWVAIRDQWDGRIRIDALQPEEQTRTMAHMFSVFESTTRALMAEVGTLKIKRKKRTAP